MTNEKILHKAVAKAVKGGWDTEAARYLKESLEDMGDCSWITLGILFDIEWAKGFWGEKKEHYDCYACGGCCYDKELFLPKWQYHQIQMVHEIQAGRDPLKYLEQFL